MSKFDKDYVVTRSETAHFWTDGKNSHIASNSLANFYSNGLHNAIFMKNGAIVWRYWSSEFDHKVKCTQVDGFVDLDVIAAEFSSFFIIISRVITLI